MTLNSETLLLFNKQLPSKYIGSQLNTFNRTNGKPLIHEHSIDR